LLLVAADAVHEVVQVAGGEFQLNGVAVWLYRSTKPSRVAESCPRLAKSLGVTTFFWMTEKKISSGNPGALPRRGPLRTGRARFPGNRLKRP
jgi:hypothetical protein